MNDAVFKFKRYEDASLIYTGIIKHDPKDIGGHDTVMTAKEFQEAFVNRPWWLDEFPPGGLHRPQATAFSVDFKPVLTA